MVFGLWGVRGVADTCATVVLPGSLQRPGITYTWSNVNTPEGRRTLPEVLHCAELALLAGAGVVVHCKQGKHRTGAFIALLKACQPAAQQAKGSGRVWVSVLECVFRNFETALRNTASLLFHMPCNMLAGERTLDFCSCFNCFLLALS